MDYSDLCCICLCNRKYITAVSANGNGGSHYDKLITLFPEMDYVQMNNERLLCKECCDFIDAVCKFREKCLRSKQILTEYSSQQHSASNASGEDGHSRTDLCSKIKEEYVERKPVCEKSLSVEFKQIWVKEEPFSENDSDESNENNDVEEENSNVLEEDTVFKQKTEIEYSNVTENMLEDVKLEIEDHPLEESSTTSNKKQMKRINNKDDIHMANSAKQHLLPTKSKELYEEAYKRYKKWCVKRKIRKTCEDSIFSYFNSHLSKYKSSTLWSKYSMLRCTIHLKEGVDISQFPSLIPFLKRKSEGYKPKKLLSLTKENVDKFLAEADDENNLLNKVILIFGISGACRRQELTTLLASNVEDSGTHFVVKLTDRSFNILPGNIKNLNLLKIIRTYVAFRSPKTLHNRFFVNYQKQKCTVQPVGVHKIASVPAVVARFLNLENHTLYTWSCFIRHSLLHSFMHSL